MAKIFIATPCYGGACNALYMTSLLSLQAVLGKAGHEAMVSVLVNESLITRGRNALVNQFMKTDADYLFFIDSDIQFYGDQVLPMIDADKDIICGIYPKKEINWQQVARGVKNGEDPNNLKHYTGSWVLNLADYAGSVTVPVGEPLEIWAGGTGFMLIKRKVFEQLKDITPSYVNDVVDLAHADAPRERITQYFTESIEPETERLLSEDYHFCRQWRLQGGKIYAAPWVQLSHHGTYAFDGRLM
jgi:hypothetical protein